MIFKDENDEREECNEQNEYDNIDYDESVNAENYDDDETMPQKL